MGSLEYRGDRRRTVAYGTDARGCLVEVVLGRYARPGLGRTEALRPGVTSLIRN